MAGAARSGDRRGTLRLRGGLSARPSAGPAPRGRSAAACSLTQTPEGRERAGGAHSLPPSLAHALVHRRAAAPTTPPTQPTAMETGTTRRLPPPGSARGGGEREPPPPRGKESGRGGTGTRDGPAPAPCGSASCQQQGGPGASDVRGSSSTAERLSPAEVASRQVNRAPHHAWYCLQNFLDTIPAVAASTQRGKI
ncbi:transcription initiation factor TFIID subunit 4-like [Pezoporus wallicus]|uniref:transcription initiation factor TFIID subunit 4-like n=1 Tax=Pezoporus wallicus TaxID=35540 RepID=UPI00255010BC|nr:transcription initiation factor TFIID subunit 4-like [Pezoporus wallicus]